MASFVDAGQPNSTLYLQNLNERVSLKHLVPELKRLFSEYGPLLDVVAKGRLALQGQAFIVFGDQDAARRALEAMQGVRIYGKTLVVRYAKYKSDAISKADGTYEIERRRREQDRIEKARQPRLTRRQIMAQMATNPAMHGAMPMPGMGAQFGGMQGAQLTPQMVGGELQLPNKVLYLQNLPEGTRESQLSVLFKRYPGFVEMRLVPNRPDLAFAEYENEMQAAAARQALDNHELMPGTRLRVAFARR